VLFCFGDRVSRTACLGWIWTVILLISAFQVATITGVSHQRLASDISIPKLFPPSSVLSIALLFILLQSVLLLLHAFHKSTYTPLARVTGQVQKHNHSSLGTESMLIPLALTICSRTSYCYPHSYQ
jgi:hypothetical protein